MMVTKKKTKRITNGIDNMLFRVIMVTSLQLEKYARFEEKKMIIKNKKDRFKSCPLGDFVSKAFISLSKKA